MSSHGHVVIAGQRLEVAEVTLRRGGVVVTITVPPGPAFAGPITVFGGDGKGCWQGGRMEVPARSFSVAVDYVLRMASVLSAAETLDITEVEGWPGGD